MLNLWRNVWDFVLLLLLLMFYCYWLPLRSRLRCVEQGNKYQFNSLLMFMNKELSFIRSRLSGNLSKIASVAQNRTTPVVNLRLVSSFIRAVRVGGWGVEIKFRSLGRTLGTPPPTRDPTPLKDPKIP